MPKKKKGGKKGKKGPAVDLEAEGFNPAVVGKNYKAMCKHIGLEPNARIVNAIEPSGDDEGPKPQWMTIDNEDGPIGAPHTVALSKALLGNPLTAPDLAGGPYQTLQSLRIWRCNIGDDGAVAVAEMLKLGAEKMNLTYVELLDNRIGVRGCAALGAALDCQPHPSKVVTLNLDYNDGIGCEGAKALCQGLLSNPVLKQLHLRYCGIGPVGALAIAQVIAMPACAVHCLDLLGNVVGVEGLRKLSDGLRRTKAVKTLDLADNRIAGDVESLAHFSRALMTNQSLTHVDLNYNHLGIEGALALQPALDKENKRIEVFKVDSSLPTEIFQSLYREGGGGGKKGKKGKKKKK